jgi:hypothetical protein
MYNHGLININTDTHGINHPAISVARATMGSWWIQYGILPSVGDVFNDDKSETRYTVTDREFRSDGPDLHIIINAKKISPTPEFEETLARLHKEGNQGHA